MNQLIVHIAARCDSFSVGEFMGIRALCLAAAAAVGVGQAEAATYQVRLTLTAHDYSCYYCEGYPKPKVGKFAGLSEGQSVAATLTIDTIPYQASFSFEYPEGSVSSRGYWFEVSPNAYTNLANEGSFSYSAISGMIAGSYFYFEHDGITGWGEYAAFDFTELAPVPLPASAALLPLGIGALAIVRKRRRA